MNVSKVNSILSAAEENASVYLSFDSTLSTTAFKTLDADAAGDVSAIANGELDEQSTIECNSRNLHMESTLEAKDHTLGVHVKTVEKVDLTEIAPTLNPNPISKRILQEFKALSSTPNREQVLRDINVSQLPDINHYLDVSITLPNIKDSSELCGSTLGDEENKENTPPICANISGITANVMEIANKLKTLSTKTENELLDMETPTPLENNTKLAVNKIDIKVNNDQTEEIFKNKAVSFSAELSQSKNIYYSKSIRKSVCEPNLQTNRPSRILAAITSKRSYSTTCKTKIGSVVTFGIPKVKSENTENSKEEDITEKFPPVIETVDSSARNKNLSNSKRKSLLPIVKAERRRASLAVRAPTVVKSSFNSPLRKILRKSCLPTNTQATRKSLLPVKGSTVTVSAIKTQLPRKSILPSVKENSESKSQSIDNNIANSKMSDRKEGGMDQRKFSPRKISHHTLPKLEPIYTCSVCSCKFRIKSLLDAHKYMHVDDQTTNKKAVAIPNTSAGGGSDNQCKYCDKKFALLRTLHIHLLQNCPKIPPTEKRKLEFTEMNHVEKAQLPNVFHPHHSSSTSTSITKKNSGTNLAKTSDSSLSSTQKSSVESLSGINMKNEFMNTAGTGIKSQMPPPSTTTVKKSAAHSGVYCTPKKTIPCNICNRKFKSILEYTEHCFKTHFKETAVESDDELSA